MGLWSEHIKICTQQASKRPLWLDQDFYANAQGEKDSALYTSTQYTRQKKLCWSFMGICAQRILEHIFYFSICDLLVDIFLSGHNTACYVFMIIFFHRLWSWDTWFNRYFLHNVKLSQIFLFLKYVLNKFCNVKIYSKVQLIRFSVIGETGGGGWGECKTKQSDLFQRPGFSWWT